jgi:hypothetical protein
MHHIQARPEPLSGCTRAQLVPPRVIPALVYRTATALQRNAERTTHDWVESAVAHLRHTSGICARYRPCVSVFVGVATGGSRGERADG